MSEKNTEIVHVARCLADIDKRVKKYDARAEKAGAEMVLIAKCLADANTRLKQIESSPKVEYATPLQLKRVELRLDSLARNLADANEKTTAKELAKIADGAKKLESDIAKLLAQNERLDAKLLEQGKGFNPRGKYETGEKYARFDLVSSNGSSFIALIDNPTEPPTKRSKQWMLIASRGGSSGAGIITAADVVGLGTAATRDVGQTAGNVLELSGAGQTTIGSSSNPGSIVFVDDTGSSSIRIEDGRILIGEASLYGNEPYSIGSNALTAARAYTLPDASGTVALTSDLTDLQSKAEVKSGNFTAINDGVYTLVATGTATDPSPVEGKGFVVFVRNATATVGGTGYATAGTIIRRVFHSGSWANYEYAVAGGGGGVPTSRTLTTTAPLTIDGGASADLSANRTLAISGATTSAAGTVPTLGATPTFAGTGAPTQAQLVRAWLGAQRYSVRIRANDTSLLQTAVSGAGVAAGSGVGRSLTSGATTGVARHAWNNGGINNNGYTFHEIASKDFRVVPWAQPVEITVRLQITAWAATTSGYLYVFFGVPAQIGTTLANRGIGFIIDNAREIKAVAHDGTTLTTGVSIGTAGTSTAVFETYRINSDGSGNVSVSRDGTLLGSITGGPTADGAQNQCGLHVEIGNGGQSLTNTVITGDMGIAVAPSTF